MCAKKALGKGLGSIFGKDDIPESGLKEKRNISEINRKNKVDIDTKQNSLSDEPMDSGKKNIKTESGLMSAAEKETRNKKNIDNNDVSRETLVKISMIEPNIKQPRKNFEAETLNELSESIKKYGVLQPLLVKKNGEMYEIIAGERRWRAAKLAGIKEVPVIIRNFEKQEAAEIAIIENIQREDLGPVEEARAYQALISEFGLTQEDVANKVFKKRSTITNSLRLLNLCDEVLTLLEEGKLTSGHARCLVPIESSELQIKTANEIIERKLSVRDTEKLVKSLGKKNKKEKSDEEQELNMYLIDLARKLTGELGTKVQIRQGSKGKGKIEIDYYSEDDLNKIIDKLR